MSIFSGLFRSRDKPKDATSGSSYRFFFGGTTSGKALQFVDVVFAKESGNQSHGFTDSDFFSVGDGEAGAFLAAML